MEVHVNRHHCEQLRPSPPHHPAPNRCPFTWLETPVSIQCSQIIQRHVQRITPSANFHAARSQQRTVGPPSIERFSVTENRPVPNDCPFTVARDSCLDSVQPNRSASRAAHHPSAELPRGPKPTEDCWATVNGTLLGNQESSSTERLSIHGGSRLPSRFSAAKLFSVMCSASPLRQTFHAARSQQRTVGPPSMERFSVTRIVQNRTVVHSRWLETPSRFSAAEIVQRHAAHHLFGRAFTRPEANRGLLGHRQ